MNGEMHRHEVRGEADPHPWALKKGSPVRAAGGCSVRNGRALSPGRSELDAGKTGRSRGAPGKDSPAAGSLRARGPTKSPGRRFIGAQAGLDPGSAASFSPSWHNVTKIMNGFCARKLGRAAPRGRAVARLGLGSVRLGSVPPPRVWRFAAAANPPPAIVFQSLQMRASARSPQNAHRTGFQCQRRGQTFRFSGSRVPAKQPGGGMGDSWGATWALETSSEAGTWSPRCASGGRHLVILIFIQLLSTHQLQVPAYIWGVGGPLCP